MPSALELVLRYRQAGGQWQDVPVPEGNLRIGRRSDCDLCLFGGLVSRYHAELRRRDDRVWIVDLGSSNGTSVNGKLLKKQIPQPLYPGQTIKIGDFALVLETVGRVEPETPPVRRIEPGKGHIFISYSRRNKELVHPLAKKLEELDFNVWLDTQDIKPGNPWRGQIVQAVAEADAFILLLSPDSVASENVRKELDLAIDADVIVLPVILQPVTIPDTLKYQLISIQRIDLFDHPEAGFSQLVSALRERQEYLAIHPRVRPKELRAEIFLPGNVSEFYREKQQRLLNFLAQATNFSPASMTVVSVAAGSVHVIVNMPAAAAYELKAQALNGNPALLEAGISALRLVGDKQLIHLGGIAPPGGVGSGQPPGTSPPGTPPAITAGGTGLKLFMWVAGAITVVTLGIYGIIRIFDVWPPSTPIPPVVASPTFTSVPVGQDSPTPTLVRTATRTSTQTPREVEPPTRTPTATPSPSSTFTRTPTSSPTMTEFVCAPTLRTEMDAFCRYGPSMVYDISKALVEGETVQIEGQNQDTRIKWWWIQPPTSSRHCWISDVTVSVIGDTSCLPIITPPPTPTPTATEAPLQAPILIAPDDQEYIYCFNSVTVDLIWSEVTDPNGIDRYEWELDYEVAPNDFSYYDAGSTTTTSVSIDLSCYDIYNDDIYRWRVRAIDGTGNAGPYSAYYIFTISP